MKLWRGPELAPRGLGKLFQEMWAFSRGETTEFEKGWDTTTARRNCRRETEAGRPVGRLVGHPKERWWDLNHKCRVGMEKWVCEA